MHQPSVETDADRPAVLDPAQRLPDSQVDFIGEEMHTGIARQAVHSARMPAASGGRIRGVGARHARQVELRIAVRPALAIKRVVEQIVGQALLGVAATYRKSLPARCAIADAAHVGRVAGQAFGQRQSVRRAIGNFAQACAAVDAEHGPLLRIETRRLRQLVVVIAVVQAQKMPR